MRRLSRGARAALAVVVAAPLAAACDGSERREAEAIVSAAHRFRSTDHASTPAAVEALRATRCTTPAVCEAREACLASGDATSEALRLKAEVERGIAALESGTLATDSPDAKELEPKLDRAAARLEEGHRALEACDTHLQALKRKYRL